MARDISELGADVFDDTPKPKNKISPKKRNYIIGLSITSVLLVGVAIATVVLCNTALSDYSNVENVMYYFTPKNLAAEGEQPTAVLYRLPSNKKFPSTFRIPTQVLGYKVVGVADYAFSTHEEIKKVIMPNTIEWIGENAFLDCTNLSSFTWSKNLKDIGVDAFSGTKFYEKLLQDDKGIYDLPSGILVYVGTNYFDDNTAIVSDKLTEAEIASIKANYPVTNLKKFSELNVKSICSGAFKNNQKITYIDLPEGLDEISNSTFEGCNKLEAINGSHSALTSIGNRAFAYCSSLAEVDLPSALTKIGSEAFAGTAITTIPDLSNIKTLGSGVFSYCTQLTSVNYTLNTVYDDMFNGCSSLNEITWGTGNANIDNIEGIGMGAFAGTAFTEFVVPKHVYVINDSAFEDCTSLRTVSLYGNFEDELLPVEPDEDEEEEEEGETGLPCVDHHGNPCAELMGVQNIKEAAFKGCSSLDTINLYNDNYVVTEGEDGNFTFPYSLVRCDGSSQGSSNHYPFAETSPTKVIFSPNMAHIGSFAFNNVTSLTRVAVQEFGLSKLLTIKAGAFKGCSGLTTIDLPHSIKRIENSAFYGCESLNNVELEELNIDAINGETFYNCPSIESIKLPETVTSIKSGAFNKTYNLQQIVLPVAVTEVLNNAFTECRQNATDAKLKVFISRTYDAAHTGGKKINFGKTWRDDTAEEYYFLGEGEERVEGRNYWKVGTDGNPEII